MRRSGSVWCRSKENNTGKILLSQAEVHVVGAMISESRATELYNLFRNHTIGLCVADVP